MSLIVQTLNRLKSSGKRKPVPPGIGQKKTPSDSRKFFIYGGIIILLSAVLTAVLLNKELLMYDDGKNILVSKQTMENPPQVKHPPLQSPIKEEKTTPATEKQFGKEKPSDTPIKDKKQEKKVIKEPITVRNKNTGKETPQNKKETGYMYSTYLSLANKYLEEKNYRKSLQYYQKAFRINPSQKVLKNIILLKVLTGETERLDGYVRLLKNDEYRADVVIGLISHDKLEFAEKLLGIFLKESKSPYLLYTKGILLEKKGNYQSALPYYKKAYQMKPEDPYIGYAYGRILEINKQYKKAVNIYRAIIRYTHSDKRLKEIVQERIRILR